mgnify:CR=1 FL=1
MRILPPHVVSLIHYTELTETGWWEKTIERCIRATLYSFGTPAPPKQIQKTIEKDIGLSLRQNEIVSTLRKLVNDGTVLRLNDDRYKISESEHNEIQKREAQTKNIELRVKERFLTIASKYGNEFESEDAWRTFLEFFIIPLVSTEGAKTYELFTGVTKFISPGSYFDSFARQFPTASHDMVEGMVDDFFSNLDSDTKTFLLYYLNAYFMVSASGLSKSVLKELNEARGQKSEFILSVDTNFVYSVLGLHDNPSNQAATDLMDLSQEVSETASISFVITDETLSEMSDSIRAHQNRLGNVDYHPALAEAMLGTSDTAVGGIYRLFFDQVKAAGVPANPRDFFETFEEGLPYILEEKGIRRLETSIERKHKLAYYVLEDIKNQKQYEEDHYGQRAKTERQITSDVVHWHLIQELRHANHGELSAFTAKYWLVTVDFRFLAFDKFKTAQQRYRLPICIHPTSLIQLLRFFVPRSEQFEQTLLNVVQMPVLSRDFDVTAEQTSLRIARNLAIQGAGGLDPDLYGTIITHKELRRRVDTASTESEVSTAIEDTLIRQLKNLENSVDERDSQITTLQNQIDSLKELTQNYQRDRDEQYAKVEALKADTTALKSNIGESYELLKNSLQQQKRLERSNMIMRGILGSLLTLFGISAVVFMPILLDWQWFLEHPHRLGLTLLVSIMWIGVNWSIFDSDDDRRKVALTAIVIGALLALAQIIDSAS